MSYCLLFVCNVTARMTSVLFLTISQMFAQSNGMVSCHFCSYDKGEFIVSNC